jgi:hypothetical protein
MVTGAGYRNEGTNNNRGIASASNKVVCTCDPHYKCACAPPVRGQKKVSSNAPTTVPAYNNVTTAPILTQPPRDPNVSAERGELSPTCLSSVPHSGVSAFVWDVNISQIKSTTMDRGICCLFYGTYRYNLKILMEQRKPSAKKASSPFICGMPHLKSNTCALQCTDLSCFTPHP